MNSVGALFDEEPRTWGLRGDKYLWRELREKLSGEPLPRDKASLQRLLENVFWEVTQHSLAFCDQFKVERFAHGGMSSGWISGKFWREDGYSLIAQRYDAATEQSPRR
jgi:hypothetical protein